MSHAEGAPAGALAADAAASVRADFDGDGWTDVAIAVPRRSAHGRRPRR
ncbi:FG-GAP repeat protein [Streptomyces mirabilis]